MDRSAMVPLCIVAKLIELTLLIEDLVLSGFIQRFNANLLGIGKTNVINGKYEGQSKVGNKYIARTL